MAVEVAVYVLDTGSLKECVLFTESSKGKGRRSNGSELKTRHSLLDGSLDQHCTVTNYHAFSRLK